MAARFWLHLLVCGKYPNVDRELTSMATFDRFSIKVVAGVGLFGAAIALSPDAAATPLKTGGYACMQSAAGGVAAPAVAGAAGEVAGPAVGGGAAACAAAGAPLAEMSGAPVAAPVPAGAPIPAGASVPAGAPPPGRAPGTPFPCGAAPFLL